MGAQYAAAAATWNQLFREFLYAEEQAAAATAARAEGEAGAPSGAGQRGVAARGGIWAHAARLLFRRGRVLGQAGLCVCFNNSAAADLLCSSLCIVAGTTATGGGGGGRRGGFGDQRSMTWRSFWAGHQAFFRHMTMAAKVGAAGWGPGALLGRVGEGCWGLDALQPPAAARSSGSRRAEQAPAGMARHLAPSAT